MRQDWMDAIIKAFGNLKLLQRNVCRPEHAKIDSKGVALESMS
jgi:hypothetical protein